MYTCGDQVFSRMKIREISFINEMMTRYCNQAKQAYYLNLLYQRSTYNKLHRNVNKILNYHTHSFRFVIFYFSQTPVVSCYTHVTLHTYTFKYIAIHFHHHARNLRRNEPYRESYRRLDLLDSSNKNSVDNGMPTRGIVVENLEGEGRVSATTENF